MKTFLFKHIDNTGLITFRIIFGLLCFLESAGAIATGWVKRTLIDPNFTFTFIGFEWLQPLPGYGMYVYYAIMSVFGAFIMLGYKYRFSMLAFALMWSSTYLMQKTSYNNHYYLLMLLSFIMVFLPANRYASIDVKLKPTLKQISMPNWCKWVFIIQLLILYFYATLAKLYPDWLDTSVIKIFMQGKVNYPIIGEFLQTKTMHYFIAYGGILFDGLIIPLLLYKPTRKYAFFAALFFHIFNSIVFQIGIFPYLALAFSLLFFEPKVIRNLFLKQKPLYTENKTIIPKYSTVVVYVLCLYTLVQVALPLRHYFLKDNVLWTEEGHRLSWRMMLRTKSANATYTIIDNTTNNALPFNINSFLTKKQQRGASSKPDIIWQFAQHLKAHYATLGYPDVSVYVKAYVSVNGKPGKALIDSRVDLANEPWHYFRHHDWILPSN